MTLIAYASTAALGAWWFMHWSQLHSGWWPVAMLFGLTLPAWVWLGWLVFVL